MNEKFTFNDRPWKGAIPLLKDSDAEDVQPILKYTAHAKVFDLNKEDDLKEYERIWTAISNGDCAGGDTEERKYCEQTQNFKVFLRWVELHYQASPRSAEMGILQGLGIKK